MKWRDRKIETVRMRVGDILPHPMNPKIHPAGQLEPLKGLLETVGKLDDLKGLLETVGKLDDLKAYRSERTGGALVFFDGHGRQSLDPNAEWDVDIYDLTDAEADLAVATFDPIGWQAEQSRAKLDELLREVSTGNEALMNLLTKQAEESGLYFGNDPQAPGAGGDDFDTTPVEDQTRVQYGDLWQCGEHRVLCGDSTKAEDVGRVMERRKAATCITDPPYNVGKDYGDSTDDDQAYTEYLSWSKRWFALAKESVESCVVLTSGIINLPMWIADIEKTHRVLSWVKQNQCSRNYIGTTSGFNCWEPVLVYGKSKKCVARDCFDIPIHRQADAEGHPCPKSIKAWTWLVENFSDEGDLLFEPFGGSGTTLIASERTNRKARLIEIEPKYVNVILSRWEAETGKQAQLLERRS